MENLRQSLVFRGTARMVVLFFFLFPIRAYTQVQKLSELNLKRVSRKYRPLIYQSKKLEINLSSGFCHNKEARNGISTLEKNVQYYLEKFPPLLERAEGLIKELKSDYFEKAPDFYPIKLVLSLDGNPQCYNATATGRVLELPVQESSEMMEAIFNLLPHELGHIVSHFNGPDQNIFDESFADGMSLLLSDPNGVLNYKANVAKKEIQTLLALGKSDPLKLAEKLSMPSEDVLPYLKEINLRDKCASELYERDLRLGQSFMDFYYGAGDPYIVSCVLHSYLFKNSKEQDRSLTLKNFLKKYLSQGELFNRVDLASILGDEFKLPVHKSKSSLELHLKQNEKKGLYLEWDQPELKYDWSLLSIQDQSGHALSSFSVMGKITEAEFKVAKVQECKQERFVCLCGEASHKIKAHFRWMKKDQLFEEEKEIVLPELKHDCYQLGLR